VLTRALVWAALALFIYFLLARLRTLALLAGASQALREAAAVRIRTSRIAVESIIIVITVGLWASRAFHRGHFDWNVGGSESPLHLELAGAWFVVALIPLTTALTVMLGLTAFVAYVGADELRELFPRSRARRPAVLRLAVMNPVIVFVSRRSPLAWLRTEAHAATIGVVTTLGEEAVGHELPRVKEALSDTVDDAAEAFDLEKRWARRRRAVTWVELPRHLAAATGMALGSADRLAPPPDTLKGARAAGIALGAFVGERKARRATQRRATLATFDERARLEAILAKRPGPFADAYRSQGLDGLLHEVRGMVHHSVKSRLSRRHSRELAKAYRECFTDGTAAWMIENVPSYPELFEQAAQAELDRQGSMLGSIMAQVHAPHGRASEHGDPQ
jgi:hypothetical protein